MYVKYYKIHFKCFIEDLKCIVHKILLNTKECFQKLKVDKISLSEWVLTMYVIL